MAKNTNLLIFLKVQLFTMEMWPRNTSATMAWYRTVYWYRAVCAVGTTSGVILGTSGTVWYCVVGSLELLPVTSSITYGVFTVL